MNRATDKGPRMALEEFDQLPNAAFVPINVLCGLYGCSPATIWRWVRDGYLPHPHRIGKRSTRWLVGDLRSVKARKI